MLQIEKSRFSPFIFLLLDNKVIDCFSVRQGDIASVSNQDRFSVSDLDKHLLFHNEKCEGAFNRWLTMRLSYYKTAKVA